MSSYMHHFSYVDFLVTPRMIRNYIGFIALYIRFFTEGTLQKN